MFADIHTHLTDGIFDSNRDTIINNFAKDGVSFVVENSTNKEDMIKCFNLSSNFDCVFSAVGIYPGYADSFDIEAESLIRELIESPKVVALGEIGLDYHYDDSPARSVQIECFEKQIALAESLNVPIVVHSRDAAEDTFDVLKKSNVKCALHCYSGSVENALNYIDMGFYISFGGVLTFKNTKKQIKVLKNIPLDRILTETDCPYMAPEPLRGSVNIPQNVKYIIKKMGEILEMDYSDIEKITLDNAKAFYGII